jgi:hypothetical protein
LTEPLFLHYNCMRMRNNIFSDISTRLQMKREATCALAVCALLAIPCLPASADIYQYTDENGVVNFSNVSVGKSKKFKTVKTEPKKETSPDPASRIPGPLKASSSASIPVSYVEIINSACYQHGVDPSLVHAVIKVESDFNPYAMSRKGAMGLMQLMPQTAQELHVRNTFSPHENIYGGVKYLRYLMDRYEGNLSLALAAYNAGETTVKKWGTVPPIKETQNYVKKILSLYNGTGGTLSPRHTIYIGYGEDGALILTDNPSKHQKKNHTRGSTRDL